MYHPPLVVIFKRDSPSRFFFAYRDVGKVREQDAEALPAVMAVVLMYGLHFRQ